MFREWLGKPVSNRDRLLILGIIMTVLAAEFGSTLGKIVSEDIR